MVATNDYFHYLDYRCQQTVKKKHLMFKNCLFWTTNSVKAKDIQYIITEKLRKASSIHI